MGTTENNNKLIAKFMDWKEFNKFSAIAPKSLDDCWNYDDMRFEHDWNWLMEVVQKIESLGYGMDIQNLGVHINTFEGTKLRYNRFFLCESSKIQAVYNACLEFIKWYNEQNKPLA